MNHYNNAATFIAPSKSLTLRAGTIGIATILVSKLISLITGVSVSKDDLDHLGHTFDSIPADWAALVAAALACWNRITKWNFNKSLLQSRTFWLSFGAAVISVLNALGMDTAALKDLGTVTVATAGKYLPALLFIVQTYGAIRANRDRRAIA